MTRISVIIPARGRGPELARTLDSLRGQTHADWEGLIVEDECNQGTAELVEALADPRLRHLRLPPGRRGAPAARNLGLERSTAPFVLFLDSDDLLEASCLERRLALLKDRPDLDFAVFACRLFRDEPGDLPLLWNELISPAESDLDRFLRLDIVWQTASPLWRRESLQRLGSWDEQAPSGQDWEFHVRVLLGRPAYRKVAEVDHHWRIATEDRPSIGRDAATDKRLPMAWAATVGRVLDRFIEAGRLDSRTRRRFAALYFDAARRVARRVHRGEGRRVWRRAHRRGLIGTQTWLEGEAFLASLRWPAAAQVTSAMLEQNWPVELLQPENRSFNRVRVPGAGPPTVSVLLPAYNAQRFVEEAVRSILRQSYRDFELIAVNDGSTDLTGRILDRLARADARLRVEHRQHRGLVEAQAEAARLAQGRYLALMDADDVSHPERLGRQVRYLETHPEVVLVGAQAQDIDGYGLDLPYYPLPREHEAIDRELMVGKGGTIRHPSVMMRAQVFRQVGGYRLSARYALDLDLFLRMGEAGRLANLPDVLLRYRQHPASVTRRLRHEQLRLKERVIGDACRRRGLAEPDAGELSRWQPEPTDELLRRFGWLALKRRRRDAALGHALALLRNRPFWRETWRLLACTARGW